MFSKKDKDQNDRFGKIDSLKTSYDQLSLKHLVISRNREKTIESVEVLILMN